MLNHLGMKYTYRSMPAGLKQQFQMLFRFNDLRLVLNLKIFFNHVLCSNLRLLVPSE